MTEFYQPTIATRHLVLKLKFSQPMLLDYYRQKGIYNIIPKGHRISWTRTFLIDLGSAGVSVSLTLQKRQHRLYRKDIVYGEKSWLRLVQRQLACHGQAKSFGLIRGRLLGQLSVLVSQDKVHAE